MNLARNCAWPARYISWPKRFRPGGGRPPAQVLKGFIEKHRDIFGFDSRCKISHVAPSAYRRHAALVRELHKCSARAHCDEVPDAEDPSCLAGQHTSLRRREGVEATRTRRCDRHLCTSARCTRRLCGATCGKVVRIKLVDAKLPYPWIGSIGSSRRIVGWRVSSQCGRTLCSMRWGRLYTARQPECHGSLVIHLDGSSQHVSIRYIERLAEAASKLPATSFQSGPRSRSGPNQTASPIPERFCSSHEPSSSVHRPDGISYFACDRLWKFGNRLALRKRERRVPLMPC